MRQLWLGLGAVILAQSVWAYQDVSPRIINGSTASGADFYVALMAEWEWKGAPSGSHWRPFCGGGYLGNGLVITAAHCTAIVPNGETFGVVLGNQNQTGDMRYEYCDSGNPQNCKAGTENNLANTTGFYGYHYTHYLAYVGSDTIGVKRSSDTVLQHPGYRDYGYDLALIKLSSVPGNEVLSVPSTDQWQSSIGDLYHVVGHGDTYSDQSESTFEPSAELLEIEIVSHSDSACQNTYGSSYQASNMLCAGDPTDTPNIDGEDSCQGDSGGPLFDGSTLIGVVSWGGQCARYYGVYADVYAMRHWLNTAKANLNGEYDFPQAIDFGVETGSLTDNLSWQFTNTSGGTVLLSRFDFSQLSSGYTLLSNGCVSRNLLSGQSCSLTLRADFSDSGYHTDVFTFDAGTTTMEVSALARVEEKKKTGGGAFGIWGLILALVLGGLRSRRSLPSVTAILAAFALTACSSMPKAAGDPEVLFNPEISDNGFEFSVISHGCTENDHLFLRVEGESLTLLRTQKDMCRAAPQLMRFVMPLPESSSVWQVENPVRYSNRVGRNLPAQ